MTTAPVVVIGLDGATWDVILPLARAGRLPALAGLMRDGAWARLLSVTPPLSPPAWTSFMTGANPGKTGIFDFIGRADDGTFRLVNGNWRALPSLWGLLSRADRRVVVLNVPMTFPPEPVNGVLIAGMDAPVKDRAVGYPEDIDRRLRAAGFRYRVDVHPSGLMADSPDAFTGRYIEEVNRVAREHGAVAGWLWEQEGPDFLMVTLVNTDRVGHAAGRALKDFADPARAASLPDEHPIVATYRAADAVIGDLLAALPDTATVILMSDHGFQPYDRVLNLNFWLKENGWLALDERRLRPSRWGRLAPLWTRLRYRLTGYHRANLLERAAFFRAVDWSRTRAFSFGAFGSIFINVRGRDPYGIVDPGREYETLCDEIAHGLLSLTDPDTGEPMIRRVRRGRDVYSGPHAWRGPDLLVETAPGYFIRNALDEYRPTLTYPAGRYGNRSLEHTGMHHPEGILLMRGPSVRARGEQPAAHIVDLMPTILRLFGIAPPDHVDGRVLHEWLDVDTLPGETRVDAAREGAPGEDYTREEEALVEEHLRGLGYL